MGNSVHFTADINGTRIYDNYQNSNDPGVIAYQPGYQGSGIIKKTLYHGTSESCGHQISNSQYLLKSASGRLGKGIYFVQQYNQALKIAKNRANKRGQNGYVIITCSIRSIDEPQWLKSGMHPPWASINHQFKQFCIDKGQIEITKIDFFKK